MFPGKVRAQFASAFLTKNFSTTRTESSFRPETMLPDLLLMEFDIVFFFLQFLSLVTC